ncbi:MAG: lipopolysaccharide transport periplasmic protein LptA [Steroidobacteraceae bacterium]
MAASHPDRLQRLAAVALACCLGAAASAATPSLPLPKPTKDPIDLTAASSDVDYRNNTLHFRQVRITQGPMSVEADDASATGLNFDNSEWTFTGNVRMKVPDGSVSASDAVVAFKDREIASAVIRGKPAAFEQKLKDSQQVAKGQGDLIEYDVKSGTVKLTGSAWLTDGANTIRGDTLIYNVGNQSVAANPGGTTPGGVHITINPDSEDLSNGKGGTGKTPKVKKDAAPTPATTPAPAPATEPGPGSGSP